MTQPEQLRLLEQGDIPAWNAWRGSIPQGGRLDLRGLDLHGVRLDGADLMNAILSDCELSGANLYGADLNGAFLINAGLVGANLARADLAYAQAHEADLAGANLREAALTYANFLEANLADADLSGAQLFVTNLESVNLEGAQLRGARLAQTLLSDANLRGARGLDACFHGGPSTLDHRTLRRSGPLPLSFLRGVGLPDNLIDYLPALLNQAIQFYSCFISYSSKDQAFAERLHADLQDRGVRCWFAPEDLKIGAKTWDAIDEAIRLRDKVLLILSENSIGSDWVEDEVTKAFAEERSRKQTVLFPVRLDDAVMETREPWAVKLRDQRNIGDFRGWKDHDGYRKAFERLLQDLRVEFQEAASG